MTLTSFTLIVMKKRLDILRLMQLQTLHTSRVLEATSPGDPHGDHVNHREDDDDDNNDKDDQGDDFIERILVRRTVSDRPTGSGRKPQYEYKVRWHGAHPTEDEWFFRDSLMIDYPVLVNEFDDQMDGQQQQQRQRQHQRQHQQCKQTLKPPRLWPRR